MHVGRVLKKRKKGARYNECSRVQLTTKTKSQKSITKYLSSMLLYLVTNIVASLWDSPPLLLQWYKHWLLFGDILALVRLRSAAFPVPEVCTLCTRKQHLKAAKGIPTEPHWPRARPGVWVAEVSRTNNLHTTRDLIGRASWVLSTAVPAILKALHLVCKKKSSSQNSTVSILWKWLNENLHRGDLWPPIKSRVLFIPLPVCWRPTASTASRCVDKTVADSFYLSALGLSFNLCSALPLEFSLV